MKRALLLITFLAFPWPATVIPAFPAEKVWLPKENWYEAPAKKTKKTDKKHVINIILKDKTRRIER